MPTYIDGIGASENIDSSGERISIAGMDISLLPVDGVFNYEHDQAKDAQGNSLTIKRPENTIGKVLLAKKIFSEQDCDDERQLYYWQKCQTPYVYVMGELFDDYKESAKDVAGMFRYDFDRKGQNERNVMNFSIEGAKIDKQGIDIVKSIARKVTITVLPCNKAAIAELVPAQANKPKDDLDGLFKTENTVEIELIKSEDLEKVFETMKKNVSHLKIASPDPRGSHIGRTKSGKDVFSHEKIHNYSGFSSQDHRDAANHHYNAIKSGGDLKTNQHHMGKMKLHMQASQSAERREQRFARAADHVKSAKIHSSVHRNYVDVPDIKKAELDNVDNDEEKNTLMNRTEDKYFISRSGLEYITQVIKDNLKEGDIDTEVRYNTNSSIYLDNADLDSLKDALNGVRPRIKIRVRHYMPNSESWESIAYVEIKSKEEDGNSKKIRIRIHAKDVSAFTDGSPIIVTEDLVNINKDITKQELEKRARMINHLVSLYGYRKQIEVRYERRAYSNKDVRITIDENLRFMNAKDVTSDNVMSIKTTKGWVNIWQLDHQLKNEGFLILEVKYQGDMPKWVKKALDNAQARKVSFSKYASAMACVIEAKAHQGFVASHSIFKPSPEMNKSLTAGSMIAAPGALINGAALQVSDLPQLKKNKKNKKKKDRNFWLARAEEEYDKWDKKDRFREFMHKRMPKLTKTEVDILGATLVLKKSLEAEASLEEMAKALKFGDGSHEGFKPAKKEKHPDIPKHADEKMEVKGNFDATVAHVEPHYSKDGPDKVYLSTGHVLDGHAKGKYKKGDKVSVRQHIMGTHIMEKK